MRRYSLSAFGELSMIVKSLAVFLGVGFSSIAFAQTGSITFAVPAVAPSNAEAIPALSPLAMTLLVGLIGLLAVAAIELRSGVLSILVAVISTGAILASIGMPASSIAAGIAYDNPSLFSITNSNGQTLDIHPQVTNEYTNNSGVTLEVGSMSLPETGCTLYINALDACSVGGTIDDGVSCSIYCNSGNASDRRLKENIQLVGETYNGLPWYRFRYIGEANLYEGVMAQDVMEVYPEAVITAADGYMRVNYQMLGLQMREVSP